MMRRVCLWLAIIVILPVSLWWQWQEAQRFWAALMEAMP
jgi:hypothetical protein